MDKVYLYSHLNIYAADAADSTKEFFRHHPPLPLGLQLVAINVKWTQLGPEFSDCLVTDYQLWSRNLEIPPLSNHA